MGLTNNDLFFEYFTGNSEKFVKDFTNYVKTNVPLFALQDELLYLMDRHKVANFKIPGSRCVDGKDHIFYFKTEDISTQKKRKIFHYIGMDI